MSAQENELRLIRIFQPGTNFIYLDGQEYISEICSKPYPQTPGGEPITDVYLQARSITSNNVLNLKISLKKVGWEFIKNHMSESDFNDIFFDDIDNQIQFYLNQSQRLLMNIPVIDLGNDNKINRKMNNGSITLGWEMMISNRPRGLSLGILPDHYVREAILGEHMEERRRNAVVNGEIVNNSGIPTHVLEMDIDENTTREQIFQGLMTVEEFIFQYQNNLNVILKANNYRSLSRKSSKGRCDGQRYLFVTNKWRSDGNCLSCRLDFNFPFQRNNRSRIDLEDSLTQLGINIRNVELDQIRICDDVLQNHQL